jgi:YfiH family protein
MSQLINPKVKFKIFDKTSPGTNGIYGLSRFEDSANLQMVQDNYRAVREEMGADKLLILKHVHGNTVIDADLIQDFSMEPEADGAVTSRQGILLSVQSADCVPVLLSSEKGEVVGGAHCGWRSAKTNLLSNIIKLMHNKGAEKISAIIGPAIHQESYEVDQLFYDEINASEPKASIFFKEGKNKQKWLFDLPGFVSGRFQDSCRVKQNGFALQAS